MFLECDGRKKTCIHPCKSLQYVMIRESSILLVNSFLLFQKLHLIDSENITKKLDALRKELKLRKEKLKQLQSLNETKKKNLLDNLKKFTSVLEIIFTN